MGLDAPAGCPGSPVRGDAIIEIVDAKDDVIHPSSACACARARATAAYLCRSHASKCYHPPSVPDAFITASTPLRAPSSRIGLPRPSASPVSELASPSCNPAEAHTSSPRHPRIPCTPAYLPAPTLLAS
ncbi:hypothetical protein BDW02DRAFT_324206 [Decorospora gaudefroyi]|uniref:Uncharacterized protein n=1 Tax=Decorospora gaudefroyi TaxID=184978 RepID=A0A6A5KEJ9_9PLEO|nr:hypothetical protein BDW02DRAFT_324206 [Decorospora gaudefroyi]